MYEIVNKLRSPVQVPIRTRVEVPGSGTRNFTTKIIPGIGSGNNVYMVEDERYIEEMTSGLVRDKIISVRHVPNKIRKED